MMSSSISLMVGASLLSLGLVIIFFSPYRRWLGFMLAGMAFWSFLEIIRASTQYLFSFTDFQGYITGVGTALTLLASWLATSDKQVTQAPVQCIEHTPVYDNDLPSASRQ
jgi:hypothetical protein